MLADTLTSCVGCSLLQLMLMQQAAVRRQVVAAHVHALLRTPGQLTGKHTAPAMQGDTRLCQG
jgi:hypothetical protein